nr:MMPL family transporter [Desulfosarcina cetonica]
MDDTIHYLVRYNTEFKKDLDKDRAMRDTLMSVGRPIIFTSLTISLGFAVLTFSHFQPTALFGFLMVVTMLSALIGDTILLPA